jgi:hypothetical protein
LVGCVDAEVGWVQGLFGGLLVGKSLGG